VKLGLFVLMFTMSVVEFGTAQQTGTFFLTAKMLANDCEASNRVADGPVPSWKELEQSDKCVSYVKGIADVFRSARLWGWAPRNRAVCLPDDTNPDQIIRIFVKYAEQHPKELGESAPAMLRDALQRAFPCLR